MDLATIEQFDQVIDTCLQVFSEKLKDYGSSWRVLRPISLVDQIFIKAQRIRNIQELGTQRIEEQIDSEFTGIINYALIALIQDRLREDSRLELELPEAVHLYNEEVSRVRDLMGRKNHDYGEAWKIMSHESFVDLILVKLMRIRQILQHRGITICSEGTASNFQDIINYAVFALIRLPKEARIPKNPGL